MTQSAGNNSTALATTAYADASSSAAITAERTATATLTNKSLTSPTLTGTPVAPTASVNTNTTQVATTAFVVAQIADDAPTKTGTGASGTWGIDITGNAATATTATNVTNGLGVGQTWQDVLASRAVNTSYQNTTGKPIQLFIRGSNANTVEVSTDNSTWIVVGDLRAASGVPMTNANPIVPATQYYRVNGGSVVAWAELR